MPFDSSLPQWPNEVDAVPEDSVIRALAELDGAVDEKGVWPESSWQVLVNSGASRWTASAAQSPTFDRAAILARYGRLAEGSLTAAFILTQHDSAVRHLAGAVVRGSETARKWLDAIVAGSAFTTVGISQLTTSRRHGQAAVTARETGDGGLVLDGIVPWVTAAPRADVFVTGGVLADGRQVLIALPADRSGVTVEAPFAIAALQASCTCEIRLKNVEVGGSDVLAGPSENVLAAPGSAGTGGLETSALALGQARAAIRAMIEEAARRDNLNDSIESLSGLWESLASDLFASASGRDDAPAPGAIRGRANALVLRATQAYLAARKGTGFLREEPAQRWARQALFFLVWSCPTPVAQAAIRDLAGVCSL
jgi:alkylation response protein AidB-like acyl-CoA dehydrogenase